MAGKSYRMFFGMDVPGSGQAPQLVLLSAPLKVEVAEPNQRWASGITGIRAWDGQKGRLAVMIDCADRMVLCWRFSKRITAEDLAEMLREAVFRRLGQARSRAYGIELLSDNGPEYMSHRFQPFVRAMGLIPCHTPRRPGLQNMSDGRIGMFGKHAKPPTKAGCLCQGKLR